MSYEEILAHIFSRGRFGIKPGLERIRHLLNRLGNPHRDMCIVHVAGTNGKGSTAAFLSAILQAAGMRTGLYTSPHLIRFTERIQIDSVEIEEEAAADLAERVIAAAQPDTTFFELVTAMAFLHFAERCVDVAVMEAGMGGSWDATNAAEGAVSVITPVSLDHCEYLGSTLAEIAAEKSGIIKPGGATVVASQAAAAREALLNRCRETGSRTLLWDRDFSATWNGGTIDYHGPSITLAGLSLGIGGRYQTVNAACAMAAAELLAERRGLRIGPDHLRSGVRDARWPGRMEMIGNSPRILLDGAHNPAGVEALGEALHDVPYNRLLLVVGVLKDKDAAAILAPLLALAEHAYAVAPAIERALPSSRLAEVCRSMDVACTDAGSVSAGLAAARAEARPDDLVLVCGSLFTVGEARGALLERRPDDFRI